MFEKKKNVLSIAKYKNAQGNLVDPNTLSEKEKIEFYLAQAMKNTIEILEISIPVSNDPRQFNRAKYNAMAVFHNLLEQILGK